MTESFPIMNGQIQVNNKDISIIAVNIDGQSVDEIPAKGDGKYFISAECDQGAIGTWDRTNWEFKIQNLTKKKTKCTLNFATTGTSENQSIENKMEELLGKEETNAEKIGTIVEDDFNNIRYIGRNPNNYIYFNCDENGTCETWRIIGLMDNIQTANGEIERLLKIIRDPLTASSGNVKKLSWDSSPSNINSGYGVNEWSESDIQKVLKNDYYNGTQGTDTCYDNSNNHTTSCPDWTKVGLKQSARDMIETVIWNTGTADTPNWDTKNYVPRQYMWERSDNIGKQCSTTGSNASYCNDNVERQTTWEGKVGLMYPSDYGYATDGGGDPMKRIKCIYTLFSNWGCFSNDWLFDYDNYQWTMTPAPNYSEAYNVMAVLDNAYNGNVTDYRISDALAIRPVVYLKSSVKITGGDGSIDSPFTLTQ